VVLVRVTGQICGREGVENREGGERTPDIIGPDLKFGLGPGHIDVGGGGGRQKRHYQPMFLHRGLSVHSIDRMHPITCTCVVPKLIPPLSLQSVNMCSSLVLVG